MYIVGRNGAVTAIELLSDRAKEKVVSFNGDLSVVEKIYEFYRIRGWDLEESVSGNIAIKRIFLFTKWLNKK
jgi:hypothetical protein